MGKIIPKTDKQSQKFWDSVENVAQEVSTWPAWKKGAARMPPIDKKEYQTKIRQYDVEMNFQKAIEYYVSTLNEDFKQLMQETLEKTAREMCLDIVQHIASQVKFKIATASVPHEMATRVVLIVDGVEQTINEDNNSTDKGK